MPHVPPSETILRGTEPPSDMVNFVYSQVGLACCMPPCLDNTNASHPPLLQTCMPTRAGWVTQVHTKKREILSKLLCPWDSPGKNTGVECHLRTLMAGGVWGGAGTSAWAIRGRLGEKVTFHLGLKQR